MDGKTRDFFRRIEREEKKEEKIPARCEREREREREEEKERNPRKGRFLLAHLSKKSETKKLPLSQKSTRSLRPGPLPRLVLGLGLAPRLLALRAPHDGAEVEEE